MTAALSALAGAALLFWVVVLLDPRRRFPRRGFLEPSPGPPLDGAPGVAAIVPARDEAAVLPQTLPTLLAQDHRGLRVVVVDDGSGDGTAACALRLARAAGQSDRLRLVEASPRPEGWSGKVHALAAGLAALGESGERPEWLLLTDADIAHPPGSARALLARAERGGFDLVSVMARLRAGNFWERVLIPPFVFFFHLLYPFGRVSTGGPGSAAAAGGCILVSREALEAAGGFAAIAGEVIDDVALARAVRRAGGRLWLGLDPDICSVRAYPHLRDLWRMVSRTAFVQLRRSHALLGLAAAAILVVLVSPPAVAAAGFALGGTGGALAALGALAAWGVQSALLLPHVRHHRVPAPYALLLPFASLLYLLMTLTSAWDHLRGRGPAWKGRRCNLSPVDLSLDRRKWR